MSHTSPQKYCLRWNNYQNNLTNIFDQLLQSETFVDVTLACDGNSVKAHKMVLSACSPFFQTLLFDNPCKHPIVILKDIGWDELKSVVEFMYKGEINVSQEQLAPLLKVAEMLKIKGLADVSRGSSAGGSSENQNRECRNERESSSKNSSALDLIRTSNPCSEPSSQVNSNTHLMTHPILHNHRLSPFSVTPNSLSLNRRKRRKMSTPERTPSPLDGNPDSHSNQDNPNWNWNLDNPCSKELATSIIGGNLSLQNISCELASSENALSLSNILKPAKTPNPPSDASESNSNSKHTGTSGEPLNNPRSTTSSLTNDLELKPEFAEMIREEERAKMLETTHGWLGASIASNLTDTYQYQIQNMWQKCWSQNQGGTGQALRFRERGPLKSWRPETMAEAIFAVLRDGLSLSQAARAFEIPYPTFVLYANRVHNMLGPSSDGSNNSDLMSDTRPKGRGRPQRILLGSWPEEHIRGVIRAVVFRDAPGGKDDFSIMFNRETGLCLPQFPGISSAQNDFDMTLSKFANPFQTNSTLAGINSNSNSNLLQFPQSTTSQQQPIASTSSTSQSVENRVSAAGSQRSGTRLASKTIQGFSFNNLIDAPENYAAALQHLQQLQQHAALNINSELRKSNTAINSSSLEQVLSGVGLLSTQVQQELHSFQQSHQIQQLQRRHSLSPSGSSRIPKSPLGLLNKKSPQLEDSSKGFMNTELLQIKPELESPFKRDEEHGDDLVNEEMELNFSTNMENSDVPSDSCPLEEENFGCGEDSAIIEVIQDDDISHNKNNGGNSQRMDFQSGRCNSPNANSNNNDNDNVVITASLEGVTTELEVAACSRKDPPRRHRIPSGGNNSNKNVNGGNINVNSNNGEVGDSGGLHSPNNPNPSRLI